MGFYEYPPIPAVTAGTVTSIDVSGGATGLTTSGGPITTSGVITLAGTLNVAHGGTGANTFTTNGVLYGAGTGALQATVAATGSQILGNSGGVPTWLTPSYANAITSLTGDVTATGPGAAAASLVATTNGTLTTLSALVSVGTITTGTWSATTIALNKGGTGQTTKTAAFDALSPMTTLGDLILGGASGTGARLGIGSTGNVLTVSGGTAVWSPPATSGTVTSVAMTVPTFLSIGGSPITSSGTLAVTLSGTALPVANGGTGQVTAAAAFNALSPITTTGDMIYSPSGATSQRLAVGSTGNVLTVSGGVPTWAPPATSGTVTSVAMTVPTFLSIGGSPITSSGTLAVTLSGTALPVANGGTGQVTASAAFAALSPMTTLGDLIYEAAGPTPARLAIGSTGNVLTVSGGVPTWAPPATSGTVTSVAMTVPTFLSISGSPVTSSGTLAVTLSGTALPIANGGTAVTSVTTAPAATAFSGWDANKNLSANNFIEGYSTTATAAGTTTLTVASSQLQYFTGTSTQTLVLPVTSTLVLGQKFIVVNESVGVLGTNLGTIAVQSSGANAIMTLLPKNIATFTCILTSGTTAASWQVESTGVASSSSSPTITNITSGSGTYNTPAGCKYLIVMVQGPGGGGGGGGTGGGAAGAGSASTTFGGTLLVGGAGGAGGNNANGAAGGTASFGGGVIGFSVGGGGGGGSGAGIAATINGTGGIGGSSYLGGAGAGSSGAAGGAAATSSGGGGGGGGCGTATAATGSGGGAGGYVYGIINSPAITYAYVVGAGGAGGAAGTSGFIGGVGAAGQIVVMEMYS